MIKFIAVFFLLLITAQFGIKVAAIAYWSYNQKVIAEELCVNKEIVELDCCGKCYLNTQLEKTEPKETKSESVPESKLKLLDFELLYRFDTSNNLQIVHSLDKFIKSLPKPNHYSFFFISNKFQPPDGLV